VGSVVFRCEHVADFIHITVPYYRQGIRAAHWLTQLFSWLLAPAGEGGGGREGNKRREAIRRRGYSLGCYLLLSINTMVRNVLKMH